MATRYWVGGTANWTSSSTTPWSASSGGAGGASVPTSADNIVFDGNSDGGGPFTVTATTTVNGANLTISGLDQAMVLATSGGFDIQIYGNVSLPASNFSCAATCSILLAPTSGTKTFDSGGNTLRNISVVASSKSVITQMTSNLTAEAITLSAVTLDVNDYDLVCASITSITGEIDIGAGSITLTGTAGLALSGTASVVAGTSAILLSPSGSTAITFAGNGNTFNEVEIAGSGTGNVTITGNNTIATFTNSRVNGFNLFFADGSTQTITTWEMDGTLGNVIVMDAVSTSFSLSKAGGGTVSSDYLNISNCAASPGLSVWFAGDNSVDGGDNDGWTFGAIPAGTDGAAVAAFFSHF